MIGARDPAILFHHILPNVITPAIIIATFPESERGAVGVAVPRHP